MKFILRIGIILILLTSMSACKAKSNVLFSDDFSNTSQKWDKASDQNMTREYYNDQYHILVDVPNYDAWANPDELSFTDVQIEVDATENGATIENDFGIICRYISVDKYYYAVISSDGYYGIFKKTAQGGTQLGQGGEQYSDKIVQGSATNHIRFDCIGTTLTLYVNGSLIDQRTDQTYESGNIGLIAGTFTKTPTDILFDNVIVYKP